MSIAGSVSIIVPTRNEVENVGPLVEQIAANVVGSYEMVFVDAESTDGTRDAIQSVISQFPVRLLDQNRDEPGLAAAIMAGARGSQGDLLLVMDADLSHPPARINDLLAPLVAGDADLVIGSRYIPGGSTPGWPLWRRIISRAGAAIAYPLTGVRDSLSGFFAIERSRLLALAPPTVGFKIAFETIMRGRPALRVKEVPIAFRDRARGRSKMSFGIALRFVGRWLVALFRRSDAA